MISAAGLTSLIWKLGRSLSPEEVVDYALGESDVAHRECEHT